MARLVSRLAPALVCAALLSPLLSGCADDAPVVTIDITTGHESDAFKTDPAVTRLEITAVSSDGSVVSSAEAEPGGSFELGEVTREEFLRFEVAGFDVGGTQRVAGRSLGLVLGNLQSEVFPVFAQRLDAFSRPPGELTHSHVGGVAGVVGERFLFVTGGSAISGSEAGGASSFAFYDMLGLGGSSGGVLEFVPESVVMAIDGGEGLFVGDGRAGWLGFSGGGFSELSVPEGLGSFESVAGGRTVLGPDASYLVGATRTDAPSDRLLVVAGRTLIAVPLLVPRQGAAATWVNDVGLVIAGGSTDTEAPGVEVLPPGATVTVPRGYEADPTIGSGAAPGLVGEQLLLFCGDVAGAPAPTRSLDLRCSAGCMPVDVGIDLGATLSGCEVFRTDAGGLLVVGADAGSGATRAFSVTESPPAATEIVLREPRLGASLVAAPNGTLVILGGQHADDSGAFTVESLFP
jgi:hypothetical protein